MIGVGLRVWPPTKKCTSLIGSTSRFSSDGINDWNLFANARVRFWPFASIWEADRDYRY
jgi:hypothetical protein